MTIEAVSTVFAPGLVPPPPGDPDPSTFMLWSDRGVGDRRPARTRAHAQAAECAPAQLEAKVG